MQRDQRRPSTRSRPRREGCDHCTACCAVMQELKTCVSHRVLEGPPRGDQRPIGGDTEVGNLSGVVPNTTVVPKHRFRPRGKFHGKSKQASGQGSKVKTYRNTRDSSTSTVAPADGMPLVEKVPTKLTLIPGYQQTLVARGTLLYRFGGELILPHPGEQEYPPCLPRDKCESDHLILGPVDDRNCPSETCCTHWGCCEVDGFVTSWPCHEALRVPATTC